MAHAQPRQAQTTRTSFHGVRWQTIAGLVIAAGFLYVIVPKIGSFHTSLTVLRHARPLWLVGAIAAALGTYPAAAGIYQLLAKHPLRFGQTLNVQLAGTFVNRVLPAGLGALSVNFDYLRKRRHNNVEAGSVIAVNNLVGLLGNALLLALALLLKPTPLKAISLPHTALIYWIIAAVVIIGAMIVLWSRTIRSDIHKTFIAVRRNILSYRARPIRLVSALGVSMLLTLCNTACLTACSLALGLHLNITQVLVIMTAGVAAGTVTPTPGGLLGAEAGLYASLAAFGVSASPALATVLAYRFCTYWMPLIFGGPALILAHRRNYL